MTGTAGFATFFTAALLIPLALFWVVKLLAWALPPPVNWLAGFFQRHRAAAAYAEAILWLLLVLQATQWTTVSTLDWILILMLGASAVESLMRARRLRHERRLSKLQSAA